MGQHSDKQWHIISDVLSCPYFQLTYVLRDTFVIKRVLLILYVSLQMLAPGGVGAAAPRCYDELRGR